MKKLGSGEWVPAVLAPSLGLPFGGAAARTGSRGSHLLAAPAVRFGQRVEDLSDDERDSFNGMEREGPTATTRVESATLAAVYRSTHYRVVAWQPLGRPAFVYMLVVGERRFVQPGIAEGPDFDAVMQNAADFVKRLLDTDVPSHAIDPA